MNYVCIAGKLLLLMPITPPVGIGIYLNFIYFNKKTRIRSRHFKHACLSEQLEFDNVKMSFTI